MRVYNYIGSVVFGVTVWADNGGDSDSTDSTGYYSLTVPNDDDKFETRTEWEFGVGFLAVKITIKSRNQFNFLKMKDPIHRLSGL